MGVVLVSFVGLAHGFVIGSGIMLLAAGLGIISRLAFIGGRSHSVDWWSTFFIAGVLWGCLVTLFDVQMPLPEFVRWIVFLFYGAFVGILFSALAEVLDFFPACLDKNIPRTVLRIILWALVLGKVAGSMYYWSLPSLWGS